MAIGFGPNADLARHRIPEVMREVEFAVEVPLNRIGLDHNLKLMPGLGGGRDVADPFYGAPATLLELPKYQIVLECVGANSEVVAVRLQVEENAGALIDAPGDRF